MAIVRTRWNSGMVDALVSGAKKSLSEAKVDAKNITEITVSGAYELPFAAKSAIGARWLPSFLFFCFVGC